MFQLDALVLLGIWSWQDKVSYQNEVVKEEKLFIISHLNCHNLCWFLPAEAFELQSNELYGVSLTTNCQESKSDHHLEAFKENREVLTKLTEQPQSDEWLELKRNEAYVVSTTFQIPTVDNVAYGLI